MVKLSHFEGAGDCAYSKLLSTSSFVAVWSEKREEPDCLNFSRKNLRDRPGPAA